MEGAIGRLALNLHAVEMSFNGSVVANTFNEISLKTMNQAIALAEFYIRQIKMLHADSQADKGELSAVLAKILNKALSKGTITARDGARLFDKMASNQILTHFRELEAMGYGTVQKNKNSWFFTPAVSAVSELSVPTISENKNDSKPESTGNRSFLDNPKPTVSSVSAVSEYAQKPKVEEKPQIPSQKETEETETSETLDKLVELTDSENGKENPDSTDSAKKVKTTDITDSTDTKAESINSTPLNNCQWTTDSSASVTDSSHCPSPLKPLGFSLKAGDRIKCYPTQRHQDNKWEVSATITEIEAEQGWFLGCTIQYHNKQKEVLTARIAGGCANWILRKL
jgi:hypothetical protein